MTTRKKIIPYIFHFNVNIPAQQFTRGSQLICISLDVTENKTRKNISSHAYNLSNHAITKVNYILNGKYKAIVRSKAQFITIIIAELTSTAVFVFQCCRV